MNPNASSPSKPTTIIDTLAPILAIHDAAESGFVRTFTFAPIPGLQFHPGQYAMLSIGDSAPSPMAFASGPHDSMLQFTVRLSSYGQLTSRMFALGVGDFVRIQGPYGTWFPWYRVRADTPLYLVAGGTGITAIRSLVHTLGTRGHKVVFYGAKNPTDMVVYGDEYAAWGAKYNTRVLLSVEQAHAHWPHGVGYVTELLRGYGDRAAMAFVCGPDPMMVAVAHMLTDSGLLPSAIFVSVARVDAHNQVVGPVLALDDPRVDF